MNYELNCPHCGRETEIEVNVESPSDYYFENTCSECQKPITEFVHWRSGRKMDLDTVIMEEVSEDFASRAEFARDCREDR
jgi:hypothetical protein